MREFNHEFYIGHLLDSDRSLSPYMLKQANHSQLSLYKQEHFFLMKRDPTMYNLDLYRKRLVIYSYYNYQDQQMFVTVGDLHFDKLILVISSHTSIHQYNSFSEDFHTFNHQLLIFILPHRRI